MPLKNATLKSFALDSEASCPHPGCHRGLDACRQILNQMKVCMKRSAVGERVPSLALTWDSYSSAAMGEHSHSGLAAVSPTMKGFHIFLSSLQ